MVIFWPMILVASTKNSSVVTSLCRRVFPAEVFLRRLSVIGYPVGQERKGKMKCLEECLVRNISGDITREGLESLVANMGGAEELTEVRMEVDLVQMTQVNLLARLIPKTSPSKREVTASQKFTALGAPDLKRGLLPLSCQQENWPQYLWYWTVHLAISVPH